MNCLLNIRLFNVFLREPCFGYRAAENNLWTVLYTWRKAKLSSGEIPLIVEGNCAAIDALVNILFPIWKIEDGYSRLHILNTDLNFNNLRLLVLISMDMKGIQAHKIHYIK